MEKQSTIFFKKISEFEKINTDNFDVYEKALTLKNNFIINIQKEPETNKLNENNPLKKNIESFKEFLNDSISKWNKAEQDLKIIENISQKYEDSLIFFILGKVNNGKSTFCNYLMNEALSFGLKSELFKIQNGQIITVNDLEFKEGSTETTNQIQGANLGKLVLIDSPGRHSVTEENGALTKKFIDIADAILFCTSSGAPCQVEELYDITDEINKNKPFVTIITRSDKHKPIALNNNSYEKIITVKNKNAQKQQESFCKEQIIKLLSDLSEKKDKIKSPVSISVSYVKANQNSIDAIEEAGINKLFREFYLIIEDAADNKAKKISRQIINHIRDHIVKSIENELKPNIQLLKNNFNKETNELISLKKQWVKDIKLKFLSSLDSIIEDNSKTQNVKKISKEMSELINTELNDRVVNYLENLFSSVSKITLEINQKILGNFEKIETTYFQKRGSGKKSLSATVGGIGGATAGTLAGSVFGPLGATAGFFIGGFLGNKAGDMIGDQFVEYYEEKTTEGYSGEKIKKNAIDFLDKNLPAIINTAILNLNKNLEPINEYLIFIETEIEELETKLDNLTTNI
jgi:predicted GTPase